MSLAFTMFQSTFIDLVTVTFSSLILAELLNVYSELHRVRLVTILAQLLTFLVYGGSMIFF
jgi:phospholipid-translocating ATPase